MGTGQSVAANSVSLVKVLLYSAKFILELGVGTNNFPWFLKPGTRMVGYGLQMIKEHQLTPKGGKVSSILELNILLTLNNLLQLKKIELTELCFCSVVTDNILKI